MRSSSMHCPGCGSESSLDQKFCRKCGLSLESVGKLVAGHQTPDELKLEKAEREQAILRRMYRWMMWGFLVLLIGVVLLVVGKTFALDKAISLVASFLLLGGTAAATYGVMSALRDGAVQRHELARQRSKAEPAARTTKELSGSSIPIPVASVTERTTQLIAEPENERPE